MKNKNHARPAFVVTAALTGLLTGTCDAQAKAICPSECSQYCCDMNQCRSVDSWHYQPGLIVNATRGDLVVHVSDGVLRTMLGKIGQELTHVGIMTSNGYHVRHNSMSFDRAIISSGVGFSDVLMNSIFGGIFAGPIFYGKARFDPWALYHGAPGTHTALIAEEMDGSTPEWVRATSRLIKPKDEVSSRVWAKTIATSMEGLGYEYHFKSYLDMASELGKNGSMCSGTIARAMQSSGAPAPYHARSYSPAQTMEAVTALYDTVFATARERISHQYVSCGCVFGGSCGPGADGQSCDMDCNIGDHIGWCAVGHDVLTSGAMDALAAGMADQLATCFVSGDTGGGCSQISHSWASGIGAGLSVSPDDLFHQPNGVYQHNVSVPASYQSGYWYAQPTGSYYCVNDGYGGGEP